MGSRSAHARSRRSHRAVQRRDRRHLNGVPLRVSDIGHAEDSVKKVATSLFMADGSPGVQLDIRRASGENTIKVIEAVKKRLQTLRETLPRDVILTVPTDDSRFIYASIASLVNLPCL